MLYLWYMLLLLWYTWCYICGTWCCICDSWCCICDSVIHDALYDTVIGFIKEIHVLQVDMSTWRFISWYMHCSGLSDRRHVAGVPCDRHWSVWVTSSCHFVTIRRTTLHNLHPSFSYELAFRIPITLNWNSFPSFFDPFEQIQVWNTRLYMYSKYSKLKFK